MSTKPDIIITEKINRFLDILENFADACTIKDNQRATDKLFDKLIDMYKEEIYRNNNNNRNII